LSVSSGLNRLDASPSDREQALAGCDAHVPKPVDPEELANVIAGLVKSANV